MQQSLAEDALPDILQEESTGDRLFPDLFDDRVSPSGMGHEVERFAQFEIMEWNRFNPRANHGVLRLGLLELRARVFRLRSRVHT